MGDFRVDPDTFELTHRRARVAMEPQAFDVLIYLIRQRDRVVSKEELMDSIWGGRFVTEAAVTSRIKQVRRALGDDGEAQRLIRTVHGRGYRFIGDIEEEDEPPPEPPADESAVQSPMPVSRSKPVEGSSEHHNLVASLEPLIGREAELNQVVTSIATHRLVTILGIGGIGKTRLVLAAARARRDADGPWFVQLAGLSDGTLLAETVASTLGIPSAVDTAGLAGVLQDRELLLILDNSEHLADAVTAFVTALLERCPKLRVLVTSRQILAAPGEYVLDLPPLAPSDAERLFLSRAELVTPGWSPDEYERTVLADLCRGLDCLPLAIELAAAQCRALSIDQLAEQLDDRFALLSGGRDGSRHASMTAAVAWSYDSLSTDERTLFEALCLFEGSFDLGGIKAVSGNRTAPTAVLLSMINKSMISVLPGSPRRYRILETLRQYVAQRRADAQTTEVQQQIVHWAYALADQAEAELNGPRSRQWMERLDHDKETVRVALVWTGDDEATRLRIAVGMLWYWYRRGHTVEALQALEPLSSGLPDTAVPADSTSVLLRGAVGVVLLRYLAGDYGQLPGALDQARTLVSVTEDEAARSYALATIAYLEAGGGQTDQGVTDAQTALEIANRLGSDQLASIALLSMGMAHLRAGAIAEAESCALQGVQRADAHGYAWGAVASSWILAKARIAAGDFSESTVAGLVRVVNDSAANRDVTSWLVGLVSTAYVLLHREDASTAAELVGIANRQGQLIGFAPEAMDPVETSHFLAQTMQAIEKRGLMPVYEQGRALSTDQAYARVVELFAAAP